MKKRWICLFVENEIGVLARISGLFSAKSYNLDSLTVGITEDSTISRMTISLTSDDKTFEQIKKQLSRSVEVIKLIDYTDTPIHMKEILFVKVNDCSDQTHRCRADELVRNLTAHRLCLSERQKFSRCLSCLLRKFVSASHSAFCGAVSP